MAPIGNDASRMKPRSKRSLSRLFLAVTQWTPSAGALSSGGSQPARGGSGMSSLRITDEAQVPAASSCPAIATEEETLRGPAAQRAAG